MNRLGWEAILFDEGLHISSFSLLSVPRYEALLTDGLDHKRQGLKKQSSINNLIDGATLWGMGTLYPSQYSHWIWACDSCALCAVCLRYTLLWPSRPAIIWSY